jgi:hypothetical protein
MAEIEPRFEDGRAIVIAGLRERYTPKTQGDIPSLWRRLALVETAGSAPGQDSGAGGSRCLRSCLKHGGG